MATTSSDDAPPLPLDERRYLLDVRRAELEERRLDQERSFSKLWAPLIIPALLSITTVVVTKVLSDAQT